MCSMPGGVMLNLVPDLERLLDDLHTLAEFRHPNLPGITRRFPSDAYHQSRAWLRERMQACGLDTSQDAAGNLFGLHAGLEPLAPILIGSHTDTVQAGGRYDGALGVLGALEVVRCLDAAGVALRHPLVVADFLAEEANDFGISCVGSRAVAGGLRPEWLERRLGDLSLAAAIAQIGGQPERLADAACLPGTFAACLELHIEQGPVLEVQGVSLGVVSGIVGIMRGNFILRGRADHAGTTPMQLRHDAFAAAAELTLALEQLARAEPGAVATVGRLELSPNQSNVVPDEVRLVAEARHLDAAVLARLWAAFTDRAHAICATRGIALETTAVTDAAPVQVPVWMQDMLLACCRQIDPRAIMLPSGAGHDAGHLARIAPAGMIFVPSVGGRSHCPEEATLPEHLRAGVAALALAVVALDGRLPHA